MQSPMKVSRALRLGGLCVLLLAITVTAGAAEYVWLEGEKPTSADFKWNEAGAAKGGVLSEDRWLLIANRAKAPEDGWNLTYNVSIQKAGKYAVWLRVGFEWIRPSVLWTFGDGDWTGIGVPPAHKRNSDAEQSATPSSRWKFDDYRRTTNLKELGFWNEVAWLNVGSQNLAAGEHTLHLKFVEGRIENPLLAVDAMCLVKGRWTPEGKLKPGEQYDAEIDRRAAVTFHALAKPTDPAQRVSVELTGLWQVARYDDPDMDAQPYEPVKAIPGPDEYQLHWMGIEVPGALWNHKETAFAHRVIYQAKVNVPAEHRGRGFKLHFSGTNWIASVLVNGKYVGYRRSVWVPWDIDISDFVEPGRVNTIEIGIKGPYYALDRATWGSGSLEDSRNRPYTYRDHTRWIAPIYPSTKGDGDGYMHGIVNPVTLVSVGNAYTEDVFVKPSVQRNELRTDVTVRNTRDTERTLRVLCEAVYDRDNRVEKTFGPVQVLVPANGTATVSVGGEWKNPKLWWPLPNPHLYRLRTSVLEGDTVLDVKEDLFGFREVTVDGPSIRINGVRRNFWNWVGVSGDVVGDANEWVRRFREEGNRFIRFTYGLCSRTGARSREEYLEIFDRAGIPGRLCSMIDGMFITYNLGDRQRDGVLVVNEPMWEGFREHVAQMTRAYRNHPSVIMYQIENELVYINGMNIYGGYMPHVEREMMKVYQAGYENDPTRPYTVGGGGDLRHAEGMEGQTLEINCPHYPRAIEDHYPDDAFELTRYSNKIERWPWTRNRPWVVGESLYAAEIQLGSYADGSRAYGFKKHLMEAKAKFVRAMYEGYRWAGAAGFFPWCNLSATADGRQVFSDLTAIARKRSHRLYGGRENRLHYKVMNDTFSDAPVTFEWSYETGGERIAGERMTLAIEPGFGEDRWLVISPPSADRRLEGVLKLRVSQPGARDFVEEKSVPVLPDRQSIRTDVPVLVYDKSGKIGRFLNRAGVGFQSLNDLSALSGEKKGLLIVGPDALTAAEAFGSTLLKFALQGNQVICLEQEYPPAGTNVPAPLKTTTRFGGYAHPQALGTSLFRDLGRDDLTDWAGDHPTFKNAYIKPTQGGRSLVECGPGLPFSALVELGAGEGMLVVCQLRVGAKLGIDPAADILLRNLIETYSGRRPSTALAAMFAPDDPLLIEKVAATGLFAERVEAIAESLDAGKYTAAVIHATRANIERLITLSDKADEFQNAGGWIMLCGVTPDSIDAFNQFVGTKHLLRPFRIERVVFNDEDHPLAATLSHADVMLYSTQAIAAWMGRYWASGNTFSHVIDGIDAAPFTFPPGASHDPYAYNPTRDDKDPYNFVNGMLTEDFWRYIRQIWVTKDGAGREHTFTLRQPETIAQINIWNNAAYSTIEDLDIVFDGDPASAVTTILPDGEGLEEVVLSAPRQVEETITLKIKSWRVRPHKNPSAKNLVGIANVQFFRAHPPSHGVFLDSAGGLVVFPKGKGGVFLNQIKFMEKEPNTVNAPKKVNTLAVILQNMGVGSRTSTIAVPGYNIRYETIDITDPCNAFMAEHGGRPGWFGARDQDLRALPKGRNLFADVMYHVVDYGTAPVPDCIVLRARGGGRSEAEEEVRGIEVGGKKADVLLFLHAADVRRPITDREREQMNNRRRPFKPPVLVEYVAHYVDGQTARIPVILEKHVDHWLQEEPKSLEQGAVAWTGSVAGAEDRAAVIYSMKAANPRPDVAIKSIDVVLPRDERGRAQNRARVGVLAVTLGTVLAK